jgi:hypothetical protein
LAVVENKTPVAEKLPSIAPGTGIDLDILPNTGQFTLQLRVGRIGGPTTPKKDYEQEYSDNVFVH